VVGADDQDEDYYDDSGGHYDDGDDFFQKKNAKYDSPVTLKYVYMDIFL
jgi:hypothetical protein